MKLNPNVPYLLITYFGTIIQLDTDSNSLINTEIVSCKEIESANIVYISKLGLSNDITVFVPQIKDISDLNFFKWKICSTPDSELVSIQTGRGALGAEPDGSVKLDAGAVGDWELFRLVRLADLEVLEKLQACDWVLSPSGEVYDRRQSSQEQLLKFGRGFSAYINGFPVLIDKSMPISDILLQNGSLPLQFPVFYHDWKVSKLLNYRPLVYLVAYGAEKTFLMLQLSLNSLVQFGAYGGDVMIITDKSRSEIEKYVPRELEGRWHIMHNPASDFIDFCKARYLATLWPEISNYQPILYTDTDVIFDAPIKPILIKLLLNGKFAAQKEEPRPLASSWSVGASLLAEDKCVVNDRKGFNSGIMCIPNAAGFSGVMSAIAECIDRFSNTRGRQTQGWFDQAIANYVTFKLCDTDIDLLALHVRWGGKSALHGGIYPRGFIHLWGAGDKLAEMREIIELLRGEISSGNSGFNYA